MTKPYIHFNGSAMEAGEEYETNLTIVCLLVDHFAYDHRGFFAIINIEMMHNSLIFQYFGNRLCLLVRYCSGLNRCDTCFRDVKIMHSICTWSIKQNGCDVVLIDLFRWVHSKQILDIHYNLPNHDRRVQSLNNFQDFRWHLKLELIMCKCLSSLITWQTILH